MHADGLYFEHFGVTLAAIDRVETTPMPTLIGADMAVEALGRAMHGGCKLRQVGLVAFEAGICLVGLVSY